ncbi:tobamovirus multiplication protein 3-like protein [Tanacetum coccineum]
MVGRPRRSFISSISWLMGVSRCVIFIYRRDIQQLSPEIAQHMLLDLPNCSVADNMVEAYTYAGDPLQSFLCRGLFFCSTGLSSLRRKAIFNVATVSGGIQRPSKEVTGGWLRDIDLLCMFPSEMCNGEALFSSTFFKMCLNAFNKAANLDVLEHPVLNFIYYLVFGGDITVFPGSLYFEEAATKTRDHTISGYRLSRMP